MKEQFIYGLNDTEMLGEIIKELTKIYKNEEITSENVLAWAKRVEVQRSLIHHHEESHRGEVVC